MDKNNLVNAIIHNSAGRLSKHNASLVAKRHQELREYRKPVQPPGQAEAAYHQRLVREFALAWKQRIAAFYN